MFYLDSGETEEMQIQRQLRTEDLKIRLLERQRERRRLESELNIDHSVFNYDIPETELL